MVLLWSGASYWIQKEAAVCGDLRETVHNRRLFLLLLFISAEDLTEKPFSLGRFISNRVFVTDDGVIDRAVEKEDDPVIELKGLI
jgi:hypothetical protein